MAAEKTTEKAAGKDLGLVALARSVERLGRRLGGVEEALAALTEEVAALDAEDHRRRPVSWLAGRDPKQAEAILVELIGWLDAVYLRYADAELPACWLWHADVVEELLWLRQAHFAAYEGRDAHISRAADWHDRHRPGVARRVTAGAGSCALIEHAPGGREHRAPLRAPSQQAVPDLAAWSANAATETPPEPSADLIQAENTTRRTSRGHP